MGKPRGSKPAERPPAFWEWLAGQHLNSDPERAEAARHVQERWQIGPWYNHRKALAALQSENSEHLHGLRLLTQDYVDFFGISEKDQITDYDVGMGVLTPLVPVGREQCEHTFRSGKRCRRDAVPGTSLCGWHGGSWINESERAEMVQKVSERLVDLSERAVAQLAALMDNAKSEKVRYDAAVAILDRVGVGPIQKVELSVTPEAERVAQEVRARIYELKAKAKADTVPGEVVSDEEGEVEGA